MAWARPAPSGTWDRPADPNAPAAAVTDYSTWILLDVGDAAGSADTGSILTSSTTDSGTGETTFVIAGTGASDVAWWSFTPVDANGNTVDLTKFGVSFHVEWTTQPSAGSNISLLFVQTEGDALTNFHGFGTWWDTAAVGPDLVFYATSVWIASAATTTDADAITHVNLPAAVYDAASARYEPMGGGYVTWYRNPGTFGADKIQGSTNTNKTLGTSAAGVKFAMVLGEGSSAETVIAKVYYRVYPLIEETRS